MIASPLHALLLAVLLAGALRILLLLGSGSGSTAGSVSLGLGFSLPGLALCIIFCHDGFFDIIRWAFDLRVGPRVHNN